MKHTVERKLNASLVVAVLFSAFCWLCLYAAYANFAQAGFELVTRPGSLNSVAGVALVTLHALGLLLLFVLGGGAAAALLRSSHHAGRGGHANGTLH